MDTKTELLHCAICQSTFIGEGAHPLLDAWVGLKGHIIANHPEVSAAHAKAEDGGDSCEFAVADCPDCVLSARMANVPLAVILGKRKLAPQQTQAEINADLVDAGRGHLVRS